MEKWQNLRFNILETLWRTNFSLSRTLNDGNFEQSLSPYEQCQSVQSGVVISLQSLLNFSF